MAPSKLWTVSLIGILVCASSILVARAEMGFTKVIVPCAAGNETFKCVKDGLCINKKYRCDSIKHCADDSDEQGCENNKCDDKQFFTCLSDSECLPISWKCDGQNDCIDGSDELSCKVANTTIAACTGSEFQCKQGLCIPQIWHCDGHPDCLDDSDEEDCQPEDLHRQPCHEFDCRDDKFSCIPQRWVCDGVSDCPNAFDEESCLHHFEKPDCQLSKGSFLCKDNSGCIGFNLLCNNVKDCKDGSDEGSQCNITCPASNVCTQGCVSLPGHKKETCYCSDGFMLASDNKTCFDINECERFGACSQSCLNKPGGFICSCDDGYELDAENNHTCLANDEDAIQPILYFSAKTEIGGFNLRTHEISTVSNDKKWIRDSIGVSFDGFDNRVYWTNVQTGNQAIVSSKIDGSDVRIVVNDSLRMPEDVAVDSFSRNIYFTDSGSRVVGVCTIDGRYCNRLITEDVDQPRGLALYPAEGLLFYSDWGRQPHISRAGMDGSSHISIIRHNIKWPNGIAVDPALKRIFWSDAQFDRLESADFNGEGRRVILEHVIRHPFSLAVFEDTLFWSDWHTKEIQSCNKFNGDHHETILKDASGSPMGIHIFHPVLELFSYSPCYGAPCSHICVLGFGGKKAVCKCPEGKKLTSDKKNCVAIVLDDLAGLKRDQAFVDKITTESSIDQGNTTVSPVLLVTEVQQNRSGSANATWITVIKLPADISANKTAKPKTKDMHKVQTNHHDQDDDLENDASVRQSRIKQHSNVIAIIIGVCFSVALFIIVTVIVCVCYKRRRKNKGAPLRFPNPTFGLPGAIKSVFRSDGEELRAVEVDGQPKGDVHGAALTQVASAEPARESLRYNHKLEPSTGGRLEFVNCSWSQPKLHAGGCTPTPQPLASLSEPMRRCATSPDMTDVKNVSTSRANPLADDSDSDDPANYGGEGDFSTGWESDKARLIN